MKIHSQTQPSSPSEAFISDSALNMCLASIRMVVLGKELNLVRITLGRTGQQPLRSKMGTSGSCFRLINTILKFLKLKTSPKCTSLREALCSVSWLGLSSPGIFRNGLLFLGSMLLWSVHGYNMS